MISDIRCGGLVKISGKAVYLALILLIMTCLCDVGEVYAKKKWVKSKYGLKALMALSSDRGKMVKELNRETKSYNNILKAIENGDVGIGDTSAQVLKEAGEPALIMDGPGPGFEDWIYKPGYADNFSKEKIYLTFDSDDKLVEWRIPG